MIKVSVTSTEVRNQSGTSNKAYSLNFQTVWFHTYDRNGTPNPYPEKCEIILDKASDGAALFYPVGDYTLAPASLYVDRSGNLAISPKLVALKPTPKPAA